jgi:SAM-dependent methyltransferase
VQEDLEVNETAFDPREYWEKRLSEKWGLHGVGHLSYGRAYNGWLYRVRKQVFLRQLRPLRPQLASADVLDVGSGTGFWLKMWKAVGVRSVVGSDLTHVAVQNLRKENPGTEVLEVDITDEGAVREFGRQFHLISAFDVLFHVVDEKKFASAIANIARLLRPGGYFFFSDCLLHKRSRHATHEVDRTIEDFKRELHGKDLEICSRVPMFVLMNTPIDLPLEFPQLAWRLMMSPVRFAPWLGHIYGALLYLPEILLTKLLPGSPTTEMVICRKVSTPRGRPR